MLAVKHLDPIMGIDVHIVQPPGPVPPVPIPHPYIGIVLDVMDYIPKIGATVYINGLPRGTGGTAGQAIPSHIPMGGMFVKPPTNESELFLGSATVAADDNPLVYGMLPVLTCQDIGMPAMPRLKKHSTPKSLMLPVGIPIPIPAGPPVMVGGPPSFLASLKSLAQTLAFGAAMKGLKKLAGKSKRLQRGIKRASDWAHDRANKLMDKVGLSKLGRTGDRIRNAVHEKICSVTGHPVDVATGKVLTKHLDFALPGPIPLRWERVWYSTSAWRGPLGHGWHHIYDAALLPVQDQVVAIRTADGRELDFLAIQPGEEAFDRKEKVTLFRDGRGYGLRMADGLVHRFGEVGPPGEPQRLLSIEDASGNRIRFAYDAWGRLERISDSGGRELRVHSDGEGRIVAIFAPHPTRDDDGIALVTYVYDAAGNLVESRDALGSAMLFEYRGHLLVRETNKNGLSFYFQYDGSDVRAKCLHTWGDGGIYDHKLVYLLGQTVVENSFGHKTIHFHKRGTVYKVIDALGVTWVTERNEFGELVREVDGLGQQTTHEHDERGNVVKTVGPDGATTSTIYDARNRPISLLDPVEGNWTWKYDELGRLVERADPLGRKIRYVWSAGRLESFIDPDGSQFSLRYDRAGNLVAVRTPDGHHSAWDHDRLGRCVRATNPKGAVQLRETDLAGRVVRVREADGNERQLTYDREGNVIRFRDAQYDVAFTYQGLGRRASRSEAGKTVYFEYDTEERLIGVRNEKGHRYSFVLDPSGEVVEEIGFDGMKRSYARDRAARVIRVDRPAQRFSQFSYDAGGRIVLATHFDGGASWFAYRKDGKLVEAGNGNGVVKLERDLIGRIVKDIQGTEWVAAEYDLEGRRARVRSSKGADIAIRRNVMGDVMEVAAGKSEQREPAFEATFTRDPLGRELERTLPGGIRSIWERDALGRPLRQEVWSGDRWKAAREYKWEPNDRLRSIVDAAHGPTHYTHDTFGHLAKAVYDDGRIDLRMPDEVGNLFRTETRADRQYGPAGQLLQSRDTTGTTHYEYDPEGNLVRKIAPDGVWTYAFDGVGNLVAVVRPDGVRVEFGYDAFGRRLFKKSRGKVTRFVWDGQILLHEWVEDEPGATAARSKTPAQAAIADEIRSEQLAATLARRSAQGPPAERASPSAGAVDAAGTVHDVGSADHPITWLIHPESFAPLAKLVGNARYGIVTDHLGVPLSMFDDGGREVWHAEIDAYGDLRRLQGDRAACPFRWPGQYEDVETGLYYNRFRYYDPQTGEFCSQDPIRLSGGLALYAYPLDPLAWIDPLGLDVRSGEGRDHVTYRATKDGKPYTGYASAPSELGLTPDQIVERRYGDDFTEVDSRAPTVVYHGTGTDGKATARGLEQHYYDVDVGPDGTGAVANRQRPVGPGNARRAEYEAAAEAHLNRCGAA